MLTIDKYRIKEQYSEQNHSTAKFFGHIADNAEIFKHDVSGNTATSYRNDFFGLLRYYKIPPELHAFNLFINRFSTASKYKGQRQIYLCSDNYVTVQLKRNYRPT